MKIIDIELNNDLTDIDALIVEKEINGEIVSFCARKSDPYNPELRDHVFNTVLTSDAIKEQLITDKKARLQAEAEKAQAGEVQE